MTMFSRSVRRELAAAVARGSKTKLTSGPRLFSTTAARKVDFEHVVSGFVFIFTLHIHKDVLVLRDSNKVSNLFSSLACRPPSPPL